MENVAETSEKQVCAVCDAHAERAVYPGLCARCEAIILAADALLEGGYDRESMVVATLAFAAYATEDARIGELRNALATVERDSAKWRVLRGRLSSAFELLSLRDVSGDISIVWRDPIQIRHERAPEDSRFVDGVSDDWQALQKAGRVV